MILENLLTFLEVRPFEPFLVYVADGRELRVPHPETAQIGRGGQALCVQHDAGQIEVLDVALITSLRTIYAARIEDLFR